jgi:hypothetical protein
MTLTEIEHRIAQLQAEMAQLRDEALELPEVRQMPGAWVRGWLESHGASTKEAHAKIVAAIRTNRAAADSPSSASGNNWGSR